MTRVTDRIRSRELGSPQPCERSRLQWAGLPAAAVLPAVAALLLACNRGETNAEPAASVPASAGSAAPSVMPLSDYCEKACKRASDCGFKRAKNLAVVGGSKDLEQVEGAERSLKEHYFACKRSCAAKPVSNADRSTYARAVACLGETECKAYERCLDRADRDGDQEPAKKEERDD